MKRAIFCLAIILSINASGQIYSSYNISMIGKIAPNTFTSTGSKYSGCWGWHQPAKNKEYAISGASHGTYFIDITNPATPSVCAFVAGSQNCTWREMKTYRNYCYIVSDVCKPNLFQIIDLQYLPDSVHVVHSGTSYFELGHTIWIDTLMARMYIASMKTLTASTPMAIFSLATPSAPLLLRKVEEDLPSSVIAEVHDMYARNDTVYVSAAWKGIVALKFNPANNTLSQLGSFSDYTQHGYNHASMLTKNGKHLIFCDEVPSSLPMHVVNVQNLGNIQPVVSFNPFPLTTPHNPFVIGNDFVVVSCYKDGLIIYDISQPNNISLSGFFDTYPQGGNNTGNYGGSAYSGNWGAYPYLPSKVIIANDMENGVFLLDASPAYSTTIKNPVNPVGIKNNQQDVDFYFYPNPAKDEITIHSGVASNHVLRVNDIFGKLLYEKEIYGVLNENIDLKEFENGTYLVSISGNNYTRNKKLIIMH